MFSFYDLRSGLKCDKPQGLPLACALGSFDGVHLGHRAIIERAAKSDLPVCVFTFENNPFGAPLITTLEEKLRLFALCGASFAAVFDFEKIRDIPAEDFAREVISGEFSCKYAVCGFNYRFGKNAEGTPELLSGMLEENGASLIKLAPVTYAGKPISSSRIRACLASGDAESAAAMLGRAFSLSLPIVHGNAIGRTLGFPTANFDIPEGYLMPAPGVYITFCEHTPAVTNIGKRPTVETLGKTVCETHIIGADSDLYGKTVTVEFYKRLRDEVKFASREELSQRLDEDRKASLEYFGNK